LGTLKHKGRFIDASKNPPETPSDYPATTEVNDLAFGQPAKGRLVESLRKTRS
jgi:predicted N-acetyltransferase YhbS